MTPEEYGALERAKQAHAIRHPSRVTDSEFTHGSCLDRHGFPEACSFGLALAYLAELQPVIDWAFDYLATNDEPCRFDHHGGCQAHGYLDLEPGEECPQGAAQRVQAILVPTPA